MVNLPRFTASHAAPLLRAYPALRDVFRTAIYDRFSAARPASRYHALVCCFAPDTQALDFWISELAVRVSAGMKMAVFAKHDPGLMPRLLDAALLCVRRGQTDAHGIKSLFLAHPQAFAQSQPHAREGRVRGIGVASAKRSAAAPDIPAIAETLPGYEVVNSYYLLAPAGLPANAHTKLHADPMKAIRHPEVVEGLARDGADPLGDTPVKATRYIEGKIQMWGKAVREYGAKADG